MRIKLPGIFVSRTISKQPFVESKMKIKIPDDVYNKILKEVKERMKYIPSEIKLSEYIDLTITTPYNPLQHD